MESRIIHTFENPHPHLVDVPWDLPTIAVYSCVSEAWNQDSAADGIEVVEYIDSRVEVVFL